jgi:glucosylceramidase
MKTNGSLVGGRLIDDPRVYRSYARYLVKFVQAYRANGITVDTLTVQNEPQNRAPDGYPGTDLPSWQEARVIEELGPMLRGAGLRTKILAFDHNWAMHPNDVATTPTDELDDVDKYAHNVLASAAGRWVSGVAYHCYYGDPSAMSGLHADHPDQAIYLTECSGVQSADPASTFGDTLKWHARNLVIGSPRNWAQTVINWNLALDPSGGPQSGGCRTCTGVLHPRPSGPVRGARRTTHRQHLVRHDRLERSGHDRGLPQPRRLHRLGRAQRERQPPDFRSAAG